MDQNKCYEMDFSYYQEEAIKTAIYTNRGNNLIYPMMGLIGEGGELAGKIAKMLRDDDSKMTPERREAIRGEIGDMLWFVANICAELKLDLGNLFLLASNAHKNYYGNHDIYQLILKLQQQISHMCILVEQNLYESTDNKSKILDPLGTDITMLLILIDEICVACALDMSRAAQCNLEKLRSRQERGVLKGDGDNR